VFCTYSKRDGKLDAVSEPQIFVGYEQTLHQYRVLDPQTGKIERTANVEFEHQLSPRMATSIGEDDSGRPHNIEVSDIDEDAGSSSN
jgi:hypothetical protein